VQLLSHSLHSQTWWKSDTQESRGSRTTWMTRTSGGSSRPCFSSTCSMEPSCAQPGGAQHGRLGGIWCVVKTREAGGRLRRKEVRQGGRGGVAEQCRVRDVARCGACYLPTHARTHSPTHPPTHSLTHSPTHSLTDDVPGGRLSRYSSPTLPTATSASSSEVTPPAYGAAVAASASPPCSSTRTRNCTSALPAHW
jgi:hypothetical protein